MNRNRKGNVDIEPSLVDRGPLESQSRLSDEEEALIPTTGPYHLEWDCASWSQTRFVAVYSTIRKRICLFAAAEMETQSGFVSLGHMGELQDKPSG